MLPGGNPPGNRKSGPLASADGSLHRSTGGQPYGGASGAGGGGGYGGE